MIVKSAFPLLAAVALSLAVAQPAAATGAWFVWKKPVPSQSPECKQLNATIDVRLDALTDMYEDTFAQLRQPGLTPRQKAELRRDLLAISARIAIIQTVNFQVDRKSLKAWQCTLLEAKVIKVASYPY